MRACVCCKSVNVYCGYILYISGVCVCSRQGRVVANNASTVVELSSRSIDSHASDWLQCQ